MTTDLGIVYEFITVAPYAKDSFGAILPRGCLRMECCVPVSTRKSMGFLFTFRVTQASGKGSEPNSHESHNPSSLVPLLLSAVIEGICFSSDPTFYSRHNGPFVD